MVESMGDVHGVSSRSGSAGSAGAARRCSAHKSLVYGVAFEVRRLVLAHSLAELVLVPAGVSAKLREDFVNDVCDGMHQACRGTWHMAPSVHGFWHASPKQAYFGDLG